MRFNPKARLDTSRTRDAGRGSRGSSGGGFGGGGGSGIQIPGGMKAGGGIGGILLIVVVVVVNQFLSGGGGGGTSAASSSFDTTRMADTGRYTGCQTGTDANESTDCARVAVENSLVGYWQKTLPEQAGVDFTPEQSVVTFTDSTSTGCGDATSDVGPFYCPTDRTIYLDTTFFQAVLEGQLDGPSGAFVEPYVLAHEYGHHIQNLLGTMSQVKTQQGPRSDSVRLELQADCYAGMWTRSAETTEDADGNVLIQDLTDTDISEAIAAATAVGDDRIQEESGGKVNPEQWTHGSAKSRVKWFKTGYTQGQLSACDTFATDDL